MEVCKGCGVEAEQHPMVGVGKADESSEFTNWPVCDRCWKDPKHRTLSPLKVHFFERKMARIATALAGSNVIAG